MGEGLTAAAEKRRKMLNGFLMSRWGKPQKM
jgi:hypothetical protein